MSQLLLLFRLHMSITMLFFTTLVVPITCLSTEIAETRSARSSYYDENTSDEPGLNTTERIALNEMIKQIFKIGPPMLFNNTHFEQELREMQADDSFSDRTPSSLTSSKQQQTFKVQRSPDGKLNLVFNDFLFLQNTSGVYTHRDRRPADDTIIFPGNKRAGNKANTVTSIHTYSGGHSSSGNLVPECDNGQDLLFCDNVRNYPNLTQLEDKLLRKFIKPELYFVEEEAQPQNVTQRMNGEAEEYACNMVQFKVEPKAGETKDGKHVYIYNDENKFKQAFIVERCSSENQGCNPLIQLTNGYTSTCRQVYTYRSMVVITAEQEISRDFVKLPSCCQCVIRHL